MADEVQNDPEGKMAGENQNDPEGKMAGEDQNDPEGIMAGEDQDDPLTVEEIFEDFKGRRTGLIKALTTDVQRLYQECDRVPDTEEEDGICLFGLSDGTWEAKKPAENVPTELPEPVLGINKARESMQEEEWLSMVASHSDAWLISLASIFGHKFDEANRKRLFDMILGLPTILAVVESTAMKQAKEKSSVPKHSHLKSKSTSKAGSKPKGKYSKPIQAKDGDKDGSKEEDNDKCGECGQYDTDENRSLWIFCESCETWFHQKCVNISPAKANRIKQYNCSFCSNKKLRP